MRASRACVLPPLRPRLSSPVPQSRSSPPSWTRLLRSCRHALGNPLPADHSQLCRMATHAGQDRVEGTAMLVQRSEESCKQYRKWLAALADYARAVITGRETVRAAEAEFVQREEELGLFLQEADSFLASQKHRSGRRKRSRSVWRTDHA